ncbi:MAG: hypothetical protein OXH70_03860 [Acidobacteria bacterium]|nr:hypothetical protein [Acidobacteriota bacterium]
MKPIILAALLGVSPSLVLGQGAACPEETCQVAPYFAGDGGFVGKSANNGGESDLTVHVICGSTTVVTTVTPDADGIVRQALTSANGLNCRDGGAGRIEIDNLQPGGWYWINDARNSAVSALIPKEAAGNEQVEPTDPGGVVLNSLEDGLATLVKEPASGRVGVIPHVVPGKLVKPCSGRAGTESASDCHLGSPEDWRVSANPSSVVRPTGGQQRKEVIVTLHGASFIETGDVAARAEIEHHESVSGILLARDVGGAPPQGEPGVLGWRLEVTPDDDRCLPANNDPDRLSPQTITFTIAQMDGVVPDPPDGTVKTTFTVNCPRDSAASEAVELVPENPFPIN